VRLDLATGALRWPRPVMLEDDLDLARSDLDGDAAYLVVGNLLRALSLVDGKRLWDSPLTGGGGSWRVRATRQFLLAHPAETETEGDVVHAWRRIQAANPAGWFPTQGLAPLATALPMVWAAQKQAQARGRFPVVVIDRKDGQLFQRFNFVSRGPRADFAVQPRGALVGLADDVWYLH